MNAPTQTTYRQLPSELVALTHHVELSEAGWRDELLERLIFSSMFLQPDHCTTEQLRERLDAEFGISSDDRAFADSVERLLHQGKLLEIDGHRLRLAESTVAEIEKTIAANQSLEMRLSRHFKEIIEETSSQLDPDDSWRRFCVECLDPLVSELGARTYELIAKPVNEESRIHGTTSISQYIDSYSPELRKAIKESIERFLDPSNPDVRIFILSRIHSHFLTLVASLSEDSLANISAKRASTIQLRLFLDTNFVFSLLDLHENPANEVAVELVRLLDVVKNHVKSQLYVFPLTVDEVTRTLSNVRRELSDLDVHPRLGKIARNTAVGRGNGVRARYLRAASNADHRLSSKDYFSPYISDLLTILRAKGLEFFNESVESLSSEPKIVDDILLEQQFESKRRIERRKTYEALRHDITLWHFVDGKRTVRIESPLDAVSWVVTVDHNLLRFDRYKTEIRGGSALPICVHPAVLIQMLQLWVPRSAEFDETMLQCVRALLPHPNDTDVEAVTLKILRTLSRFEGVDGLQEEVVSAVLLNRALRERMGQAVEDTEQDTVVRDALIAELKSSREDISRQMEDETRVRKDVELLLKDEQACRNALEEELRQSRTRVNVLEEEAQVAKSTATRLERDLKQSHGERQSMEYRLERLERESASSKDRLENQERLVTIIYRAVFGLLSVILLTALEFSVALVLRGAKGEVGADKRGLLIAVILLVFGLWTLAVEGAGRKVARIQQWTVFVRLQHLKRWLFGTLLVAIVGSLIVQLILGH